MARAENKASRLLEIEALLLAHPEGLTQAELSRRLGVNRSTVHRYLPDLTAHFPVYEDNDGRIFLDRQSYLVNVRFSLHEALAVHLAARLLVTRLDRQNPHAAAALRKLGLALEGLAPFISRHMLQSADLMDTQARTFDPQFLGVLENLGLAWAEGRKVRIWHRTSKQEPAFNYLFSPYFIEPYAVGQSIHTIGMRQPPGKIRTFKVERIERVELLRESYSIPADFDPRQLLSEAWGIWYTESEPVEVALKFSPQVANRVQENRWHTSQRLEELSDGSLLWRARVAEPQEMLPWIRGWGADVEVLQPEKLREMLANEAWKLAEVYKIVEKKAKFYSHSKEGREKYHWQTLLDHLTNTAELAAKFGKDSNLSELAYVAGLAHDIGKYSTEFQARLEGSPRKVDHATAGAQELIRIFTQPPKSILATLLAYCISGHHTGLLDYGDLTDLPGDGTLQARLKTTVCDYSNYKNDLDLSSVLLPERLHIRPQKNRSGFSCAFLTRMVYSALVDADFQDTEEFIQGKKPRGEYESIAVLCKKLNTHLQCFENPETEINRKRTEILQACRKKASDKPGFFSLTVPTGGGKTLASMSFALNHAVHFDLRRIIYVIPFTSIIEQNAGVFKQILGEENVLEHHSNFDWEQKKRESIENLEDRTRNTYEKLRLAAENWDIPVIVTTNVQFFESLFANKSSACRKLHNISKSVIIFDEAQLIPKDYLLPTMAAIWELVTNYSASAVFCTATQPVLEQFMPEGTVVTELAPDPPALFNFFRRVEIKNLKKLTDDELISRLQSQEQVLCILNTRLHTSGLFHRLEGDGNFHLSTLMCPVHRKQTLVEIRKRLMKESQQTCRVVSTSVMEAGIDLDFPQGYRAFSGLDSINQAAGRVNRNMARKSGQLFIFEPVSDIIKRTPPFIAQGVEVTRSVYREHEDDPISIPAIEAYFKLLYSLKDSADFDFKGILNLFDNQKPEYEFATAARNFQLIEEISETVVVPFDEEARRLIEELKFTPYPLYTLRKLQPYTVSIFKGEFDTLSSKGAILIIAEKYAVLNSEIFEQYYHPDTGLLIPGSSEGDAIFA